MVVVAMCQIERGATDKEIRKAYRNLSLQYHPDKNPDPVAAQYFAEKITKAYAALTGEPYAPWCRWHTKCSAPSGLWVQVG